MTCSGEIYMGIANVQAINVKQTVSWLTRIAAWQIAKPATSLNRRYKDLREAVDLPNGNPSIVTVGGIFAFQITSSHRNRRTFHGDDSRKLSVHLSKNEGFYSLFLPLCVHVCVWACVESLRALDTDAKINATGNYGKGQEGGTSRSWHNFRISAKRMDLRHGTRWFSIIRENNE